MSTNNTIIASTAPGFSGTLPAITISGSGLLTSASTATWTKYITESDFNKLLDRVTQIEQRLLLIPPDTELQEKYPSLKEAYDSYKFIEKIVNDKSTP